MPTESTPPTTELPSWLSGDEGAVRSLPCGRWWDAVCVPEWIGTLALESLAGRSGPVIASPKDAALCWLVSLGAAANWDLPLVRVYGEACYLSVPSPTARTGCVYWVRPPVGNCLTDAVELHDALAAATDARIGPRPTAEPSPRGSERGGRDA